MEKEFLKMIKMVASVIQTDYPDQETCKKAIQNMLSELDKKHIELTGESMYQPKSILEHLLHPRKKTKIKTNPL